MSFGNKPKFFRTVTVKFYTNYKDRFIGHFSKDFVGQESGCKFLRITHFVLLIPCFVIEFDTQKFISHQKGCWHLRKKN